MSMDAINRIRRPQTYSDYYSQQGSNSQSISQQLQDTDIFSYAKEQEKDSLASQGVTGMVGMPSVMGANATYGQNIDKASSQNQAMLGINPHNSFSVDRGNNVENSSSVAAQSSSSTITNPMQQNNNDGVTNPNNTNNPGKMADFQGTDSASIYTSPFKKQIKSHELYMLA